MPTALIFIQKINLRSFALKRERWKRETTLNWGRFLCEIHSKGKAHFFLLSAKSTSANRQQRRHSIRTTATAGAASSATTLTDIEHTIHSGIYLKEEATYIHMKQKKVNKWLCNNLYGLTFSTHSRHKSQCEYSENSHTYTRERARVIKCLHNKMPYIHMIFPCIVMNSIKWKSTIVVRISRVVPSNVNEKVDFSSPHINRDESKRVKCGFCWCCSCSRHTQKAVKNCV